MQETEVEKEKKYKLKGQRLYVHNWGSGTDW